LDIVYTMNAKPFTYRLPLSRFDTNLLPSDARKIGSDSFKDAVIAYFVAQYASKGEVAIVTVDDQEISVLTLPVETEPLDFVLSLLQAGQIKEAVPFLESIVRSEPDNVQALYNLGIAHSELGDYPQAIMRLKRAVAIQPDHAHAWSGLGVAYQRMGKPELALEPLQRAVAADPLDGFSLRNLGGLLLGLGRPTEAEPHLRAARRLMPNDQNAVYGLAAALDACGGESNETEADELYAMIINRWPDSKVGELAREARTKRAHAKMRSVVDGGLRPDVMMYIAGALDTFEKVGPAVTKQIATEIAMKGQRGLDINSSDKEYTLNTLPGKFSGIHLVSIMYAAFKQIDPSLDGGIDLHREYDAAVAIRKKR
jgi:tetratricopeptide (TPR) repeat protein